ncbi:hypothetical protein [Moorena sp. SIOASIH]|nr:hypothetical protein [Moorena sp. SIOASIH]
MIVREVWEVWEVWGDGEMGRWGDGEMGRWGDGKSDQGLHQERACEN